MKIILTIIGAAITVAILAWVLGWAGASSDVVSARNVKAQYAEAYKNHESLTAIAANYCAAKAGVDLASTDDERGQRVTQLLAQQANYSRVEALYNAQMRNGFEGRFVRPTDLPAQAPTAAQALAACP